jgi:hypothetical protein
MKIIGVIGSSRCDERIARIAEEVGGGIARHQAILICGGLGGVMEAACRGAKLAGGLTIGVLPGDHPDQANQFVDIPIVTDIGIARNIIIVRSSSALIAINGSHGTLSEIAFALQLKVPVYGIETWDFDPGIIKVNSAMDAIQKIFQNIPG